MKRITLSYGLLPTFREFEQAYERETPAGYNIQLDPSDSRACDGFMLRDGEWSATGLYRACKQIVSAENEVAMNLVSSILETLGFDWI